MDTAWFKAKTAGIPRWAWIAGLGGAVLFGLYLRSRTNTEEEYGTEEEPAYGEEYAEGGTGEGGLAGAGGFGLGGGTGTTTTPVQTPYIPEGFTEMFGQLTELVGRENEQNSVLAGQLLAARESGGGGAPEAGNHEPLFTGPEAAPYTEPKPQPTAPSKPQCPQNVRNKIQDNQNEMQRIQGEINSLQSEITTLTNNLQAHPQANQAASWKSKRDADQTNIASKRQKVQSMSDENNRLRQTAGCS